MDQAFDVAPVLENDQPRHECRDKRIAERHVQIGHRRLREQIDHDRQRQRAADGAQRDVARADGDDQEHAERNQEDAPVIHGHRRAERQDALAAAKAEVERVDVPQKDDIKLL